MPTYTIPTNTPDLSLNMRNGAMALQLVPMSTPPSGLC